MPRPWYACQSDKSRHSDNRAYVLLIAVWVLTHSVSTYADGSPYNHSESALCPAANKDFNDKLLPLHKAVTAFFPSIYMTTFDARYNGESRATRFSAHSHELLLCP